MYACDCVENGQVGVCFDTLPTDGCESWMCNRTECEQPVIYQCCIDINTGETHTAPEGSCGVNSAVCLETSLSLNPDTLICSTECRVMCCTDGMGNSTCELAEMCARQEGKTMCGSGQEECAVTRWRQECVCDECNTDGNCERGKCCNQGKCDATANECLSCPSEDDFNRCTSVSCSAEFSELFIDGVNVTQLLQ